MAPSNGPLRAKPPSTVTIPVSSLVILSSLPPESVKLTCTDNAWPATLDGITSVWLVSPSSATPSASHWYDKLPIPSSSVIVGAAVRVPVIKVSPVIATVPVAGSFWSLTWIVNVLVVVAVPSLTRTVTTWVEASSLFKVVVDFSSSALSEFIVNKSLSSAETVDNS